MQRLVEVVQRRARERAQRFVGRTLEVLVEGAVAHRPEPPARPHAPQQGRQLRRPRRAGRIVDVGRSREATSQTLVGEQASPARARRLSTPVPSVRRSCEHMFVRWDGQTVENDEQARLPGHAGTAVVRRFDAPEALDTRFYEVRAKTALNRVPAHRASRSPGR